MKRLETLSLALSKEEIKVIDGDYIKLTDNRTGKSYDITLK
jgi:hypothetical protein